MRAGAGSRASASEVAVAERREAAPAARRRRLQVVARLVGVVAAFALATAGVATLEGSPLEIEDASSLYLVAVVLAATFGTRAAIAAALTAFLLYDVLFVEPRFTLTVDDPREWLDLGLLVLVGVTIGRLAGLQADRAADAERRLREARALFQLSRTLATTDRVEAALPAIVRLLVDESGMDRIRVTRARGGRDVVEAEAGSGPSPEPGAIATVLVRMPDAQPARWVRSHRPGPATSDRRPGAKPWDVYEIRIEADGERVGSLWGTRGRSLGPPGPEETRVLSLAADQLGLALQRERLAAEAAELDLARRREAVERSLLESVSHDLRTPLASIRAAAGSLADASVGWSDAERRHAAERIDAEAARLDGLVGNLLDLSRIQGGTIAAAAEPWELAALVEPAVRRLAPADAATVRVQLPDDLPPVLVDPVLLDQALANVLENAARHAPGAPVALHAAADQPAGQVVVRIEDDGPGVPQPSLERLFDRFYRGRQTGGPRRGLGIGLTVVRGAVEAMGGTATAERSPSGGLAVVLRLPIAPAPAPEPP